MDTPAPAPITLVMAQSVAEVTGPSSGVDFTVLQMNDVYEAGIVDGGFGSLARVATLRQQLAQENPNLLTVLVGDFLSPSPIAATTGDRGLHMIETLNAVGITHVTLGNHEFDVPQADLMARIEESQFKWVVSNVTDASGAPFPRTLARDVVSFANLAGQTVRVALIGICTDMVRLPWVRYQDAIASANQQVAALADQADVVIALTHLTLDHDKQLAEAVERLDVLMGGHEHQAATAIVGADQTPIFKADSNARSVCIHRFRFDPATRVTKLFTELRRIDDRLDPEPATAAIVQKWEDTTFKTLRAQGMEPTAVVGTATQPLQGHEEAVRSGPTNLTQYITQAFLAEVPGADVVTYPAGMIRVDAILAPGDITSWDVVRIFPLAGNLSVLDMPGALLVGLLNQGEAGKGTGAYMVTANVSRAADGSWLVGGAPIVATQLYKVVTSPIPAAILAYSPFKGTGTTKDFDTRGVRDILADRLRRDAKPTLTTAGTWTEISGALTQAEAATEGVGTSRLSWGQASHRSGYQFDGVSAVPAPAPGAVFTLGTFTHHDFPAYGGAPGPFRAVLRVSVALSPAGAGDAGTTLGPFDLAFELLPRTPDQAAGDSELRVTVVGGERPGGLIIQGFRHEGDQVALYSSPSGQATSVEILTRLAPALPGA